MWFDGNRGDRSSTARLAIAAQLKVGKIEAIAPGYNFCDRVSHKIDQFPASIVLPIAHPMRSYCVGEAQMSGIKIQRFLRQRHTVQSENA